MTDYLKERTLSDECDELERTIDRMEENLYRMRKTLSERKFALLKTRNVRFSRALNVALAKHDCRDIAGLPERN